MVYASYVAVGIDSTFLATLTHTQRKKEKEKKKKERKKEREGGGGGGLLDNLGFCAVAHRRFN